MCCVLCVVCCLMFVARCVLFVICSLWVVCRMLSLNACSLLFVVVRVIVCCLSCGVCFVSGVPIVVRCV